MRAYRKVNDQYEFRVDGGRLTLLGVGAALVVLLVFLLGVLVGKALWGGRRELPPLPQVQSAPALAPEPAAPEPVVAAPRPQYTFYEELKKPDPVALPPEPARPPSAGAPSVAKSAAVPTTQPAPKPKPEPKTVARPPPVVFTVQVGSFRDRGAASALARQVGDQGVSANVSKAFVAGRTWYRVQVGRFEIRSDAENYYRTRLRSNGVQGFVTTR